jgi:ATP-binding cassette, subfamily B, multidrug efflux pump
VTDSKRSPWAYLARYRGHVLLGCLALLVTSALALIVPYLLGKAVEALQGDSPGRAVLPVALTMIGVAIAQAATRIASRILLFNGARLAEYDLRSDLFAHLLRQAPSFYRTYTTGDVMSRLTSDVQTVRAMWGPGVLNVVNTTFIFATALVLMVRIDPYLALWALLPYPIMVLFGRFFASRLYHFSRAVQDYLGTVSAALQEDLSGVAVIKTYALEPARMRRFRGMADELLVHNMKVTLVRGQLVPVLGALGSIGTVVVLYAGGSAVIDQRISLGQLVQFNAYLALLVWPTLAFGWMLSLFQRGMAAWSRLRSLLQVEPAIQDGAGGSLPNPVRGELEIRHLTVEIAGKKLLDDVSLRIPANSITAVVGRTGAGKTLLLEAIARLLETAPGTIFFDGVDVSTIPLAELRRAIGYAPQEAFLFSSSIAENIGHGAEHMRRAQAGNTSLDLPRIQRAAQAAGLSRDLKALPHGFDTTVGERGITLSGGQRQRVALARALAADPRVLILDDSLSSVDTETEREILAQLEELMHGRTSILISHRIAAIKRADQIVVLDDGKVVEIGTHEQLLTAGGVYAELYRTQLEDLAIDEGAA